MPSEPARSPTCGERDDRSTTCGTPTIARPGTPEKVEVLRERVLAGVALWDPHDQTWTGYHLNPEGIDASENQVTKIGRHTIANTTAKAHPPTT
ncbi:MAG: hypothetical protein ACJ8C4_15410 [Gemmataceae bacterium]